MVNHLKRYLSFVLCALLVNTALLSPVYLMATQEAPSQEETAQFADNNEQSDEEDVKKPTMKESWRKVITLRWKELTKADAWNIGAPVMGIAALGVWYYWPKNGIAGNPNNNPGPDNPDPLNPVISDKDIDNFELSIFDLSSEEDVRDNLDSSTLLNDIDTYLPNELKKEIISKGMEDLLMTLEGKARSRGSKISEKNIRCLFLNEVNAVKMFWRINRSASHNMNLVTYFHYFRLPSNLEGPLTYPKGYKDEEIENAHDLIVLMKRNLTIPQIDLINRMSRAAIKEKTFTIYCLSEDGKVFLTFDKDVRVFLLKLFNVDLQMGKPS